MQHVFIAGAKSLGAYGGYETFVNKLTEYHRDEKSIQYHIACKAGGYGGVDRNMLNNMQVINDNEYYCNNAHCFEITVPDIGPASAIIYDLKALDYCCRYIKENNIRSPVVYILACRIGPFMAHFARKIHRLGGVVYINPDGHEWKRSKWPAPVKAYWKLSERLMVKNADLTVCDSINIEKYIKDTYADYSPRTTYIAYGAEVSYDRTETEDGCLSAWYKKTGTSAGGYYLIVGRFVPENNYETMLREFMKSDTGKDLILITNKNEKLYKYLDRILGFTKDKRIKFAGTVYDRELLKKIRKNARGYLHGHEVGGTNPSLLEALGSTAVNMVYDIGFNREVAAEGALYWDKTEGDLARLISAVDRMADSEKAVLESAAKTRIEKYYSWDYISEKYRLLFSSAESKEMVKIENTALLTGFSAFQNGRYDKILHRPYAAAASQRRCRGFAVAGQYNRRQCENQKRKKL